MNKIRILQLMSYPVDDVLNYINEGHPYHGHNLYGYLELRKKNDLQIDWFPNYDAKPKYKGGSIVKRKLWAQFQCLMNASKYDVIYSPHDIHILLLAFLKYIGILKTPILMVCHFSYNMKFVKSPISKILKRIERFFVFRAVDQVLWADQEMLELAKKDFTVPLKHQKVANWGANIDFFDSYIKSVKHSQKQDYFAAMGWANRDYMTLCKAFDGTTLSLKILAGKRSIPNKPNNVDFVDLSKYGIEGMARLREYYFDAIAICLPITTSNDVPNGATVLIEALAMGKPLIVTDSETNYIDVEKEKVGLKVKRSDVDGWRKALYYLVEHPEIRMQMGINARKLAESRLNLHMFTDNVYNELKILK